MTKWMKENGLDMFDGVFVVGTLVYALFYMAYCIKNIIEVLK